MEAQYARAEVRFCFAVWVIASPLLTLEQAEAAKRAAESKKLAGELQQARENNVRFALREHSHVVLVSCRATTRVAVAGGCRARPASEAGSSTAP